MTKIEKKILIRSSQSFIIISNNRKKKQKRIENKQHLHKFSNHYVSKMDIDRFLHKLIGLPLFFT